jgi:hypothetical protein
MAAATTFKGVRQSVSRTNTEKRDQRLKFRDQFAQTVFGHSNGWRAVCSVGGKRMKLHKLEKNVAIYGRYLYMYTDPIQLLMACADFRCSRFPIPTVLTQIAISAIRLILGILCCITTDLLQGLMTIE